MTLASTASSTALATSDREIVLTQVVDAPREAVFDAWTSPEHLPYWMLGPSGWPMPVCEVDLRPGGSWQFVWRRADGAEWRMRGVYREVARPERLVYTVQAERGLRTETLNTLLLEASGGRTVITYAVLYPSVEARTAALRTGLQAGAAESLENLAEYLESML